MAGAVINFSRSLVPRQYGMMPTVGGGGGRRGQPFLPTGSANPMYDAFMNQYMGATNESESRYNDALGEYQGLRDRSLDAIKDWGGHRLEEIDRRYDTSLKNSLGDLANRGFNSPHSAVLTRENTRDALRETNSESAEQLLMKLNLDRQLTGDTLGFMERRTDQQPSLTDMAALAQQAGQAGMPMGQMPFLPGGGNQMMAAGDGFSTGGWTNRRPKMSPEQMAQMMGLPSSQRGFKGLGAKYQYLSSGSTPASIYQPRLV